MRSDEREREREGDVCVMLCVVDARARAGRVALVLLRPSLRRHANTRGIPCFNFNKSETNDNSQVQLFASRHFAAPRLPLDTLSLDT